MIGIVEASTMPNIETLLRDHVTLNVDCIDRLYLNGYVPRLQRPENLWWFLTQHRGWPVPSPQLLKRLTDEFVGSIDAFAERHRIPVVRTPRCPLYDQVLRPHRPPCPPQDRPRSPGRLKRRPPPRLACLRQTPRFRHHRGQNRRLKLASNVKVSDLQVT